LSEKKLMVLVDIRLSPRTPPNVQLRLVPLGHATKPRDNAPDLLVGTVNYEDFMEEGKPFPELNHPWTMIKARAFRVQGDATKRTIADVRSELVSPPTSKAPLVSTVIMQGRRRNGTLFPGPNDLTSGVIDPFLVCVINTRVLKNTLGYDSKLSRSKKQSIHDAIISILRTTHPKMYAVEVVAVELGGDASLDGGSEIDYTDQAAEDDEGVSHEDQATDTPTAADRDSDDSLAESDAFAAQSSSRERPLSAEVRRMQLLETLQPHINALRAGIRDSGAYEQFPYLHHAPGDVVAQLLPMSEALAKENFPPKSIKQTRYRLRPPTGPQEFTHNVACT
jgi:hypothetical protein